MARPAGGRNIADMRRRSGREIVGAGVGALVAGAIVWGVATDDPNAKPDIAGQQANLCTAVQVAADSMPDPAPKAADEACANGFHAVPETKTFAASEPGCPRPSDDEVTPIARTTVAARPRIAFFAPRIGSLPGDGPARVGGVTLPAGSRCPHYWATDAPTTDALALARRLARMFPQTGLWPILWDVDESPDHYTRSSGDPRDADRIDAEAALRRVWTDRTDGRRFGGLAPGSEPPATFPDPFGKLAESDELRSSNGQVLLLVPVHRPADAIAMTGFIQSEVAPDAALTAVARSWEERFGAFVVSMGPVTLGMAVSAPPAGGDQAKALEEEQWGFAPESDDRDDATIAAELPDLHFWAFGWPD
jgi:hypothetical protein